MNWKKISAIALLFNFFFSPLAGSFELQEYEKKIKNNFMIQNILNRVKRQEVEKTLRDFVASGRPGRIPETAGHKNALEYLKNRLKDFSIEEFPIEESMDKKGYNLIWEKKGNAKPDEVMILGANYDSLLKTFSKTDVKKEEAPGADNNASGVSILLSMIEILEKLNLPKTVKIVFFDYEAEKYLGSKAFVNKLFANIGQQKIVGFINLTSLGHDTKKDDTEKKFKNMTLYIRPKTTGGSEQDLALGTMLMESGKRINGMVDFVIKEATEAAKLESFPETANHFGKMGIGAVTMTQNRESDLNPRHFTSNDFVETLNMSTYTSAFMYITSSVLAWNYGIVK